MKFFLAGLIIFFSSLSSFAQKGNGYQKEAIRKLNWMLGTWAGTSTVNVDSTKQITNIRETVQSSLDGTILQITVVATDKDTNTRRQSLAYTSFSVISYDLKNKKYRWTTWRNNGDDFDQHEFSVGDNSFEYVNDESGGKVRYKASLGSKGEFLETGEYSKNGTTWGQFITMKLVKMNR